MLPLRKKPKTESSVPAVPAWHPNLRNYDRLPDTKVVRTAFFVNGAAVLAVAVLVLWLTFELYQLRDAHKQIEAWQEAIDREGRTSTQAIAQFKAFQADATLVGEVDGFLRTHPQPSEILLKVGETLPAAIALDRFELRDKGVVLRGSVRGSPDQASGSASAYLEKLKGDPYFSAKFFDIRLVGLTRNAQTGRMTVEIAMKLKESK